MARAFLLTWNPDKFAWGEKHIQSWVKKSADGIACRFHWSCSHSKQPAKGERAFLMKLGKHGRGVFASGWITRGSYPAPKAADFGPRRVDVEWDVFLEPRSTASLLDPTSLSRQHWTPENSGIAIAEKVHDALEMLWAQHIAGLKHPVAPQTFSDAELQAGLEFGALEGQLVRRLINHRRRERSLRNVKLMEHRLKHGSLRCEVCGFDFLATYGVDYAEVHHVKPLSLTGPTITKPSDLAVICANCHRVAHLDPKYSKSIEDLRALVK